MRSGRGVASPASALSSSYVRTIAVRSASFLFGTFFAIFNQRIRVFNPEPARGLDQEEFNHGGTKAGRDLKTIKQHKTFSVSQCLRGEFSLHSVQDIFSKRLRTTIGGNWCE